MVVNRYKPRIRFLRVEDVETVYEIECESFIQPWDKEIFRYQAERNGLVLTDHMTRIVAKVIEVGGKTVGYIIWEECYAVRTGRILNIAIRKKTRQQGLGSKLMNHAFESLRKNGMTQCVLEARESNIGAHRFYEHLGMLQIDRVPNYYGDEDAVVYFVRL